MSINLEPINFALRIRDSWGMLHATNGTSLCDLHILYKLLFSMFYSGAVALARVFMFIFVL